MQFDLANRVIRQCSQEGETVLDPFGGLHTVAYCAVPLKRKSVSIELNPRYHFDGTAYVKLAEQKLNAPTLFDMSEYLQPEEED
jgi:DNA modification methylase